MKTKILVMAFSAIFILACSKNSYNTKPSIKIKSLSGNVFDNTGTLTVQLQVTDKEGDVTDNLFMNRIRYNKKTRITLRDTIFFKVPDAPNATDGIIQLDLNYRDYLAAAQTPLENDTIAFRFALTDKAGNTSDTIISDKIVVIR